MSLSLDLLDQIVPENTGIILDDTYIHREDGLLIYKEGTLFLLIGFVEIFDIVKPCESPIHFVC
jgi:hypothetical protein